jgi:hypothetical protein
MLLKRYLLVLLLVVFVGTLPGCDGEGVFLAVKTAPDGNDVPDDDDDDTPPDPIPDGTVNLGTWITSYVDDEAKAAASSGLQAYAVVLKLEKDGSSLTGTGTMYRVFEFGTTAADKVSIKASGTITGDDASLSIASATSVALADTPAWRLRFAGNYLVGAYRAVNGSNQQVRNGHAIWRKQTTPNLNGAWVSAYSDAHGTTAMPERSRTAAMVLTHNTSTQTLPGTGNLLEQVPGLAPLDLAFNIVRSTVSIPNVGFTMGDLDMAANEVDWYALASNGLVVGAFAQYDLSDRLIRAGSAKWYLAPDSAPNAVNATWATSFCDDTVGTSIDLSCYLATLTLQAGEGNTVTGSGELIDAGLDIRSVQGLTIENGTIVGSHVTLEARQPITRDVFIWDLRIASSVMAGSYQLRDSAGQFVAAGTAEWRKQRAAPSPTGTWAASYYDRIAPEGSPLTQHVLVNVSAQAADGSLSGNGALRFMNGETGRRLFNLVSSSTVANDITWVWRGTDLFGDTTWRLRHTGDFLYGVYENLTAGGNLESMGAAMWVRTSTTTGL